MTAPRSGRKKRNLTERVKQRGAIIKIWGIEDKETNIPTKERKIQGNSMKVTSGH